jgi:anti-anti-sigma factor
MSTGRCAVSPSSISIGHTETAVLIRVVGHGSHRNSQPLRTAAIEMIESGYARFTVDLAECSAMDSTFLGVLAGIGFRLREPGREGSLRLVNVGPRNRQTLETLGLDRLLTIDDGDEAAVEHDRPARTELHLLAGSNPVVAERTDRDELAALMLEAHEDLGRADPRNVERFEGVTRLLRERASRHGA